VAEAVDFGGVGVDVLAQRVRVLEEQAERLGVVGRLEGARRTEQAADTLATGLAGLSGGAGAEHDGLEEGSETAVEEHLWLRGGFHEQAMAGRLQGRTSRPCVARRAGAEVPRTDAGSEAMTRKAEATPGRLGANVAPMPETDSRSWRRFALGHALSIFDEAGIQPRLVYDESSLNTSRTHVVWLSPNEWGGAGGSRYGNVSFDFDFRSIIRDKRVFWVGAMPYTPTAVRLLVTERDWSNTYLLYDPTVGDGPWWHDTSSDTHWWNGDICVEFILESDVPLSIDAATSLSFVNHHDVRCNVQAGGGCRDAGRFSADGSARFVASWTAFPAAVGWNAPQNLHGGILKGWNKICAGLNGVQHKSQGLTSTDATFAHGLARAMLGSASRGNRAEFMDLAAEFANRSEAVQSLAAVVSSAFGVPVAEFLSDED
jgi:hypothetical protein